jgi:hypothetical protein
MSCLSAGDLSRDATQSRNCKRYSSWVSAEDCAPGATSIEGYNTFTGAFNPDSSGCCDGDCTGKRYFAKCFKTNYFMNMTPAQISEAKFKCCAGQTEQRFCDPNYCPLATNCKPVYFDFCGGDKISTNYQQCQRLKTTDITSYNELVSAYCLTGNTDGTRFREAICQDYCQNNLTACTPKLLSVCKDKKPNDTSWSGVCGCFYPPSVYSTFNDTITKKWNVPPGTLTDQPRCSYPDCVSAAIKPPDDPARVCKPLALTTCLQNVTVDATGAVISGGIVVSQNAACASSWSQKGTTPTPSDGTTPSTPCTVDSNCPSGQHCVSGTCVPIPSAATTKFPVWGYILIAIGVLFLLGIIGYFALGRKPTPARHVTTTKSPPPGKKQTQVTRRRL